MSIDELKNEARAMTKWHQFRFLVLIAGTITVSIVIVMVSLNLYNSSGAAQVDLSRPGYQSIRKEASENNDPEDTFDSTGSLNSQVITNFQKIYNKHANQVIGVDSFGPDALSDDSLELYLNQ